MNDDEKRDGDDFFPEVVEVPIERELDQCVRVFLPGVDLYRFSPVVKLARPHAVLINACPDVT